MGLTTNELLKVPSKIEASLGAIIVLLLVGLKVIYPSGFGDKFLVYTGGILFDKVMRYFAFVTFFFADA